MDATTNPKSKALKYSIGFALLLLALVIVLTHLPEEAAQTGDLAVTFLGVTNNPVASMKPIRLAMAQSTTGLCAVFRVSNVTTNCYLAFKGDFIEMASDTGWKALPAPQRFCGVGGMTWSPNYGCLVAVAWPPSVPTNSQWRMVVNVEREERGFKAMVNGYAQRYTQHEVFVPRTYGQHTIRSTEVDARVPFGMPGGLN